ncbi:uncharacterized protein LOC110620405 isoform X1 [Manihot esculenta]|uniref:uncharacterized protein LOC110620405 isoform X1 n=1 Tax=Manihot esculenta TaxID=3983 RepID=UPI001CC6FE3D|nr:uncharacterized protein LOC110620405 isoform X1 [Manihot esculenta]
MACAMSQLLYPTRASSQAHLQSSPCLPVSRSFLITSGGAKTRISGLVEFYCDQSLTVVAKSSQENDGIVAADDDNEDGVSLGTLKLPGNTDLNRFESLLFQWANSLCQGANLPLPVPLKLSTTEIFHFQLLQPSILHIPSEAWESGPRYQFLGCLHQIDFLISINSCQTLCIVGLNGYSHLSCFLLLLLFFHRKKILNAGTLQTAVF